ncbi:hypothetical protein [Chitinophaga rhizosphaerae]|uniref:hypothetical protein n=1 Tax=Chitinophaga rhizosphaerae TaxID=1864947 RepID=UPI001F0BF272|nr:hypothetical protein [Chitinophaga rhizosphaerae]
MNLKSTPANLAKLEKIFDEAKYIIRYEKGTFNSGYCILEHKKVVVVNKFLNVEGRINTLLDILPSIALEEGFLTPESQKLYRQVLDSRAEMAAAAAKEETSKNEAGEDGAEDETADENPETPQP